VSATPPIEIVCEISSLEEPIRGRLRDEAGRSIEFRGWMDFSSALLSIAGDAKQSDQTESLSAPNQEGPTQC
jgi:hypothetical protein